MADDPKDFTRHISDDERATLEHRLGALNPLDGKYAAKVEAMREYFCWEGEARACARVQRELLAARVAFGQADKHNLRELDDALERFDPVNAYLLENPDKEWPEEVKAEATRHDQLAVLAELGRHVSEETAALLHPGTTSYDILDTARSWLLRRAWDERLRPRLAGLVERLCERANEYHDLLQVGRTHLQHTSPITVGLYLAQYANRLADRSLKVHEAVGELRGKVSGITGSGASVEMVIGDTQGLQGARSIEFEKAVLASLGLEPDYAASQIVQRERTADVAHAAVTTMGVLADFAEDMRLLYSSDVGEVTSVRDRARLGGSSADAGKNNPINWENVAGMFEEVRSGMHVVYAQIVSNLQRDLRNSVQARYQPGVMLSQLYESLGRVSGELEQLTYIPERLQANLSGVMRAPSEAFTAILRKHGYSHPEHGLGHEYVKRLARQVHATHTSMIERARRDAHFAAFYNALSEHEQQIMRGELDRYVLAPARERMAANLGLAYDALRTLKG